jgi:glycosyltransferase involved in cell wall biosynthesis
MSDYQVVWRGFIHGNTGYARASREYLLALHRAGVDVRLEPLVHTHTNETEIRITMDEQGKQLYELINNPISISKPKVLIYHSQPNDVNVDELKKTFKYVIINTVWETTKIPDNWLEPCNKADAILLPSSQNINAFKDSGVTTPIYLVPHGADIETYNLNNTPLPINDIEDKFTFLSVFQWQHRKSPEVLLNAFWHEFTSQDNVALIIKTHFGNSKQGHRNAVTQLAGYKRSANIPHETATVLISPSEYTEENLKSLYASADVFVLPSRGEGVGLPYIEALCSGVPVIATNWGGQTDFLNEGNSYLVDYELEPTTAHMDTAISYKYDELFTEDMMWAEPSISSLRQAMRQAYENQKEALAKGLQGRKDMESKTWDNIGNTMKIAIEMIIATKE